MELIGILSAFLVLGAFIANEYEWVSSEDIRYDSVNFVASLGLLVYAVAIHAWPFVLTNAVWALVSGADVYRYVRPRVEKYLKKVQRRWRSRER